MNYRDKILGMLKKQNTLTFEDITDDLRLDYACFEEIITSMQNDNLVIVDGRKETVSLKKIME